MSIRSQASEILHTIIDDIFEGQKPDSSLHSKLFTEIRELMLDGLNKEELLSKITNYKENNPDKKYINSMQDIMQSTYKKTKKNSEKNLMQEGVFYYHPRLQETPPLPTLEIDIRTGSLNRSCTPFYLEMVDSFTLNDLLEYTQSKVKILHCDKARELGALTYLLKKYKDTEEPFNNLDLLLYTIDAGGALMEDLDMPPLANLLKLDDFLYEGWILYRDAYNRKKMAGMDKVITRRDRGKV